MVSNYLKIDDNPHNSSLQLDAAQCSMFDFNAAQCIQFVLDSVQCGYTHSRPAHSRCKEKLAFSGYDKNLTHCGSKSNLAHFGYKEKLSQYQQFFYVYKVKILTTGKETEKFNWRKSSH